jgi:hypothetical protein
MKKEKQLNYLRIINQSYNKGLMSKKEYKKEIKYVRNLSVKNTSF